MSHGLQFWTVFFNQNMFSTFSTDGGLNFQINSSCVGVVPQWYPKSLENGGRRFLGQDCRFLAGQS